MLLLPRAAILAVVTFCVAVFADATALRATPVAQDFVAQNDKLPNINTVPATSENFEPTILAGEIVQPLPVETDEDEDFATLHAAVAAQDISDAHRDEELKCLAVGVYYESKGEPLAGQLAVAEVILNRSNSGRFPGSVCSVLKQPGQFSFVRRGQLPKPPVNAHWRKAVAVAQVAQKDLWESPVDEALFFHATYVNPRWKRPVAGKIGNHIFYR